MKKTLNFLSFILIFFLFFSPLALRSLGVGGSPCYAAEEIKDIDFPEDTTPTADDWVWTFDVTGTVPRERKVLFSNVPKAWGITAAELAHLSGVTSAIQAQINAKAPLNSPVFTGIPTIPTPFTLGAVSVTATGAELNFVIGVTSAIQTQLNAKAASSHAHAAADTTSGTFDVARLPSNSSSSAGIVSSGSGQVNLVWKTDASGVPGWREDSTGGSPSFSDITSATNVTAAMAVGTGASLGYSGTGTIDASHYKGSTGPSAAEFGYIAGVTSAIQTQIDGKAPTTHLHDAEYISIIGSPTAGNFPTITAGGELQTSSYGPTSFSAAVHTHSSGYITDFQEAAQDAVLLAFINTPSIYFTYSDAANTMAAYVYADSTVQKVDIRKNTGSNIGSRRRLNLIEGSNVTLTVADDAGNNEVGITIAAPGVSGYNVVQEEGTPVTQRTTLNFIGAGITAADDAGNTRTNVTLDATLNALAGLTIADVSIIEGTGADAFNVVTSGGNNYFLASNSGNTALEFKTPAATLTAIGGQASDGDLTALAALTGTGIPKRTADNTWSMAAAGTDYSIPGHLHTTADLSNYELTSNGGMENGNPPTRTFPTGNPETHEQSAVQKHSGTYSCHIIDSSASYGGFYLSEATNIKTAGETYKFSCWVYLVSGSIYVDFSNGDLSAILGTSVVSTTGSWQYVEMIRTETITGPSVARFWNVSNILAAEFYIDSVSLVKEIPIPLNIAEQTIVGRATGGVVTGLPIDSDLSSVSGNDDTIPSAKATKTALDGKQSLDATLTALAGLTITQGSMIQGTGTDAFSILAKGTLRQILQMNAGATAFEWSSAMDGITIGGATPAAGTFTTLTAGAAGFSVDADGDVIAKSLTITKQTGVAGDLGLYEANSTDTDAAGFRGPASLTANTSYRGQLPNAKATSDKMVLAWTNVGETGTGTPSDPFIQALSFIDLDGYALINQTMYIGTTSVAINRGSGALVMTGITSIDGTAAGLSAPLSTAVLAAEVDGHTNATNLTAAQQENTTIHNVGQGANAVTLNLATLVNGMAFTLDVGEAQTSQRWRIKAQSGQYIYLLGSDGTTVTKGSSGGYIGATNPAIGNCLACKSFKDGASSVGLQCKVVSGAWTQE